MTTEPETISVTELRERMREVLENACFRRKRYRVERAGQPMVVIIGAEEFERLIERDYPGRERLTISEG